MKYYTMRLTARKRTKLKKRTMLKGGSFDLKTLWTQEDFNSIFIVPDGPPQTIKGIGQFDNFSQAPAIQPTEYKYLKKITYGHFTYYFYQINKDKYLFIKQTEPEDTQPFKCIIPPKTPEKKHERLYTYTDPTNSEVNVYYCIHHKSNN